MTGFEKIFEKLVDLYGPELVAEFAVFIQNRIEYKKDDIIEWEPMANKELKEEIQKYKKAGEILDKHNRTIFFGRSTSEVNYLELLSTLTKSEAVERVGNLVEIFLTNQKIVTNINKTREDLPSEINKSLFSLGLMSNISDTDLNANLVCILMNELHTKMVDQEYNDEVNAETRNWEEGMRILSNSSDFHQHYKEEFPVCDDCGNYPCRCSLPD